MSAFASTFSSLSPLHLRSSSSLTKHNQCVNKSYGLFLALYPFDCKNRCSLKIKFTSKSV